jgi:hypothetical protein
LPSRAPTPGVPLVTAPVCPSWRYPSFGADWLHGAPHLQIICDPGSHQEPLRPIPLRPAAGMPMLRAEWLGQNTRAGSLACRPPSLAAQLHEPNHLLCLAGDHSRSLRPFRRTTRRWWKCEPLPTAAHRCPPLPNWPSCWLWLWWNKKALTAGSAADLFTPAAHSSHSTTKPLPRPSRSFYCFDPTALHLPSTHDLVSELG